MKKKTFFIPVLAVIFTAFLLGVFFDYEISTALFSENNLFGILMASIGELPMYGGVALAGGMLFVATRKHTQSKRNLVISAVVAFASTAFGIYFQGKAFCSINAWGAINPNLADNLAVALPIGLVLVIPCLLLGLTIGKKGRAEDIFRASLVILITGFLQIALITVLKGVFHRPRFRSLAESGAQFKPVFIRFKEYGQYIAGSITKEEFKSFPSGHTGSGAMICAIGLCLPYITSKANMKKQSLYFLLGAFYTIVLAVFRIVVGAHYLTDVCFSAMVTLLFLLLVDYLVERKLK